MSPLPKFKHFQMSSKLNKCKNKWYRSTWNLVNNTFIEESTRNTVNNTFMEKSNSSMGFFMNSYSRLHSHSIHVIVTALDIVVELC